MFDAKKTIKIYQSLKSAGMTDDEIEKVFAGMILNDLMEEITKKVKEKLITKMTIVN
jgi:SOS response regulatory protein OraA/RecX